MNLKIIGAGFPRTGTTTLKKALELLGYEKTYHFKDLIADPDRLKHWEELEKEGSTDFEALFKGYCASVDFPGYPYYKILLKKYPDAKVILTKRDFEAWYNSTYNTVWQAGPQTIGAKLAMMLRLMFNQRLRKTIRCIKFMRRTYLVKQFDHQFAQKSEAEKVFYRHLEEVKAHVPAAQLLVYDVAEGWEPLCHFLNKPIPAEPFPHLNKKEHFHEMVKGMIADAAKS